MTTNEQNEADARRLKELRVRVADGYALASGERENHQLGGIRRARELGILPWSHLSNPTQRFEVARDTIDFLLSLIDSQATKNDRDLCIELVREMREDYEALRAQESHPAFAHHYTVCRNTADKIIEALEAAANPVPKDSEGEGGDRD